MKNLKMHYLLGLALGGWIFSANAHAAVSAIELTQKTAENQIRHLIEPILDRYCHEECKLMNVTASVDVAAPDQVAPGFDEMEVSRGAQLAASGARVKILINDKVGPISRGKLLDLVQQYLDTLEYPVKVETQVAHFPQPVGAEGRIAELRERVSKQFKNTLDDLLAQFCPKLCLVTDFNIQTDVVNGEETQYGSAGEFVQEGDTAVRIKDISATILMDESLSADERANILEMAKLKTNYFKNVTLNSKVLKFPKPAENEAGLASGGLASGGKGRSIASTKTEDNQNNSKVLNTTENKENKNESSVRQEKFERIEKIERVENGDAVQAELQKFKVYGMIFACSILSLLIFIAMASARPRSGQNSVTRVIQSLASDPVGAAPAGPVHIPGATSEEKRGSLSKRYEIESMVEELVSIYAQQPKVAKQVFSRILTEEGVETTAECISLFGEAIVLDMLRDPSLQTDLNELMEFYAKNPIEMTDDEKIELLKGVHARTVAGKLVVMGNRSSTLFDFLAEMDGLQIMELVRNESLTVKAIVMTQCDPQKRTTIYSQLEEDVRMKLLNELSRIDYLPRDYIFNVANALKRKRKDNPRLNTEALPGSEVLVNLLERTGQAMQRTVVKNLETSSPDSARTIKSKLVSIDTLKYLRDGQLLEVVLSLKHEELLQFLKGASPETKKVIFAKAPKELSVELEEELAALGTPSREGYAAVERKVLNRMKVMANEGIINLVETNERMFQDAAPGGTFVDTPPPAGSEDRTTLTGSRETDSTLIKKVAGW